MAQLAIRVLLAAPVKATTSPAVILPEAMTWKLFSCPACNITPFSRYMLNVASAVSHPMSPVLPVAPAVLTYNKLARTLLPVMLPPALIMPAVIILPAVTLPVAVTRPDVAKLPETVLPDTLKLVRVPTLVKLEFNTLLDSVLPINALAKMLVAITSVNCDPLPIKKLPVTLPVALTLPAVFKLLPVIVLALVIVPVALTSPTVVIFPPETLPMAVTNVSTTKLPYIRVPLKSFAIASYLLD